MLDKDKNQNEDFLGSDSDDLTDRFFTAIHAGDLSALDFMISQGAEIDMTDAQGHSGFYYAVWGNDLALAEYFLEHHADRAQTDTYGTSILHWAVQASAYETVRLFLDYSFNTEIKDRWGRTPLWYAVTSDNTALTDLLLSEYADPEICDITGENLLSHAAKTGGQAILETLIARGADPDQKSVGHRTLLHAAVENKNDRNALEIVLFLLEHSDLSPTDRDDFGQAPLDVAAFLGKMPLVQCFIDRKILPDFNTVRNAIAGGAEKLVFAFLDFGIDPNLREEGTCRTFLHYAVKESSLKFVRALIERGLNPNITDCYGESPLFYALSKKDFRVFRYLLDCGADPAIANEDGQTVLHRACAVGDLKITRYLIEKKNMDPKRRDLEGRSAIDLANRHGDFDLTVYFNVRTDAAHD